MSEARLAVMEAIARRQTVTAQYNGATMTLAPHILYAQHDDLFVAAFNFGKNWRSDEERRLGRFKLDGLRDVALTGESFEPLPTLGEIIPDYEGQLLLAVE